jgi:hypothetical protein
MSKENLNQIKFEYSKNGIETIFTDIVQIQVNNETVSLELGIRNKDGKTAEVGQRIIMTLPHFMRFADVCYKSANDISEQLNLLRKETK